MGLEGLRVSGSPRSLLIVYEVVGSDRRSCMWACMHGRWKQSGWRRHDTPRQAVSFCTHICAFFLAVCLQSRMQVHQNNGLVSPESTRAPYLDPIRAQSCNVKPETPNSTGANSCRELMPCNSGAIKAHISQTPQP